MANTLTLPPDLAAKVQAHVDSGAAADAVEVVRAGLEALEAAETSKLAALRAKLSQAIADPSPSSSSEDVFARVEAVLARK
jgi:antitoxin ParD1/3/4